MLTHDGVHAEGGSLVGSLDCDIDSDIVERGPGLEGLFYPGSAEPDAGTLERVAELGQRAFGVEVVGPANKRLAPALIARWTRRVKDGHFHIALWTKAVELLRNQALRVPMTKDRRIGWHLERVSRSGGELREIEALKRFI